MSTQYISMGRINPKNFILILAATCLLLIGGAKGGVRGLTNLEIRRQLRSLNKPTIKSIKTEDGNIIDCVDIYKQPAFDHPLLKNHTIQMRPSNYDISEKSSSKPLEQLWRWSERCPEGTIPITRTRKSDLLKKISLDENPPAAVIESAKLYVEDDNLGAYARINAWNVHAEPGEHSTASLLIGVKDKRDKIDSGWTVSQAIYGDNYTHAYIFWESDNGGCYNLKCPGFIQTYKDFEVGVVLYPLSIYGGDQYVINVKLYKDKAIDHWWLEFNEVPVGYWPGTLFKNMAKKANLIQWGGEVWNTLPGGHHTSTQMGSGQYPIEGSGKAAFIRECIYTNLDNEMETPSKFSARATKPACYDISDILKDQGLGVGFFFGGPGGVTCDQRK